LAQYRHNSPPRGRRRSRHNKAQRGVVGTSATWPAHQSIMAPLIRRRGTRSIEPDPCLWTGDRQAASAGDATEAIRIPACPPRTRAAHATDTMIRPSFSRVFKPRAPCTYALGPSLREAAALVTTAACPGRWRMRARWQRNKRTAFSRPGPMRRCALRPSDRAVRVLYNPAARRQRKSHDESYSKLRY
jgi:hypothetical protein